MSVPHPPFQTEADAAPPRPGWAKALGICHILIAIVMSFGMLASLGWVAILAREDPAEVDSTALMGMDTRAFFWFTVVDSLTGMIGNGLTFASGIGLINLKPWGARIWHWLAPAKIIRLILVWGGFIVAVAPGLAAGMSRSVVKMFEQQNLGRGKIPTVAELSLIYAWGFLAMGIGMMVLGSIYPAVTWWLVRRPGIKLALVDAPPATAANFDLIRPVVGDPAREADPS